jgi:hypothetical protein
MCLIEEETAERRSYMPIPLMHGAIIAGICVGLFSKCMCHSCKCFIRGRAVRAALLNAVYMKVQEGYVAVIEELPGANTQGETLDEARENLK